MSETAPQHLVDLMQAIDACENKWLKVAFHLAFAATVRIGELLGLTWDCVDVSEEAIAETAPQHLVDLMHCRCGDHFVLIHYVHRS